MAAQPMQLTRHRPWSERIIEALLFLAAALGVLTTIGIVVILFVQTLQFFQIVNPIDFLTGTVWSASIQPYKFGVLALVSGTLLVAVIAMIIGIPLGLLSAILLSEYSSNRVRNIVKPVLETIAGIPTIVLGFFAINFLSPEILQPLFGVPLFSPPSPAASSSGSSSRRSSRRSRRTPCGRCRAACGKAPTRWAPRSSRSSARSSCRPRSRGSWHRSSWP